MLTTIKGVYDHGKIILSEEPPVKEIKSDVIITFLSQPQSNSNRPKRVLGGLENKISVPDDFNEPMYNATYFSDEHCDPFDRYLIAIAESESIDFNTKDEKFKLYKSGVEIIW